MPNFRSYRLLLLGMMVPACVHAQSLTARYLARVSATQAEQPRWMTPIATVTPLLEQEFRFDTVHDETSSGNVTNFDGGKGLELIPARRVERCSTSRPISCIRIRPAPTASATFPSP